MFGKFKHKAKLRVFCDRKCIYNGSDDIALIFTSDELSRRREFQEKTEKVDNGDNGTEGKFSRAYI